MSAATALNIRRLGLIIEVLCMIGMLSIGWPNVRKSALVFGVPLYQVLWVGLGCGLALWCIGTFAYRLGRRRDDR